jgi:hypothetical protein
MDTVTLVESQIDDGEMLLDRLGAEGFVVRAACWVKPVEEDRWSLYIATPAVDERGPLAAYGEVLRVLRSLGKVSLTSSDIKLVGEKHPVAQGLLDILRDFSGWTSSRARRPLLGGIPVEDLYVYPPGKKVQVPIYGLIFTGEPSGALHLSFEPHNPQSTLEVESKGDRKVYHAETGIDWFVAAPWGATLERNANGQRVVLAWDLHGKRVRSSANEIWSLARLGLHGFRFLREPA